MRSASMWAACSLALLILLAGCRSVTPPVAYYTLRPTAAPSTAGAGEGGAAVVIGVGPVDLPGTVNRLQMVTRRGENRLEFSSLHRWADYPDRMVQRVIGENLQLLLPDARVVDAPWPVGLRPDLTVTVTFQELIAADDQVRLSAVWVIAGAEPAATVHTHRLELVEPTAGGGYDERAAAHSRALGRFCRALADSLTTARG